MYQELKEKGYTDSEISLYIFFNTYDTETLLKEVENASIQYTP